MEVNGIVLINRRFEFLNNPDKLEIFDRRNLKKDANGRVTPVDVIILDAPKTDLEAGKLALASLRDKDYITQGEYLQFLDMFLAAQIVLTS